MFKPPSYQTNGSRFIEAEKFGEHLTGDHLVVYRDNEEEIIDSRLALVIKDVATGFLAAYPSGRKSQDECYQALNHFVAHNEEVGIVL